VDNFEIMVRELYSKQQIRDVIMTAARGSDRGDKALLKSCYHPDALEDHASSFSGKAYDYIDGVGKRPPPSDPVTVRAMHHFIGNILVTLDGDVAWAESYTVVFARMIKADQEYDTFTGGRYCDRLEFRDGAWKISYRKIVYDWNRDVRSAETWLLGIYDPSDPKMNMGARDRSDISYTRF